MRAYGDPYVTRKQLRREARRLDRGRRASHRAETSAPRRGSTWLRRHQWRPDAWTFYYHEAVG